MKKIYLIIIGVVLISSVIAVTFTSKSEARNYFINYKSTRETEIDNTVSSITYTTDKECLIDYHNEEIMCSICFTYTFNNATSEICMELEEGTTIEEDDNTVREVVKEKLKSIYPIEEVNYVERPMKDRKIQVK